MKFSFRNEVLNRHDSVTLEAIKWNYSNSSDDRQMYSGNPYPLGLDPVGFSLQMNASTKDVLSFFLSSILFNQVGQWAENKITFTNSAKMKFAILVGIFPMAFGVFLSL